MKMTNKILIALLMFAAIPFGVMAQDDEVDPTTRKEREHIKAGNALYELQRYAEAEVEYKKALEVNPNSQLGNYNLALSLIQQGGANNEEQENNPLQQATELLNSVAQNSKSADLRSKAFYNLGNLAYVSEKYDVSVGLYKNSLRNNPDDDQARDNLRMAQLKLQQQQQNKGKDKNKQQQGENRLFHKSLRQSLVRSPLPPMGMTSPRKVGRGWILDTAKSLARARISRTSR